MEVRYAPDDVKLGEKISVGSNRGGKAEVIEIGEAVVIVRDKSGYTRTLLRKPVKKWTRKKPANIDAALAGGHNSQYRFTSQ
jgi:hypothetical protein